MQCPKCKLNLGCSCKVCHKEGRPELIGLTQTEKTKLQFDNPQVPLDCLVDFKKCSNCGHILHIDRWLNIEVEENQHSKKEGENHKWTL